MRASLALPASLLLCAACAAHPAPPPEPACTLTAEELPARPPSPDLLRLAGQYAGALVEAVVGAHVGDTRPIRIAADGFDTLFAVRETGAERAELLAYRSAPELRRFVMACRR